MKTTRFPVSVSRHACDNGASIPSSRPRPRPRILSGIATPVALFLACAAIPSALGDAIFTPGDPILGGQFDLGSNQFLIGHGAGAVGTNSWPDGEAPAHAIDGVAQKYLNFGITNTGFLVNPSFNSANGSVISSMQLWTANDSPQRDPASYQIWGTNTSLDFAAVSFDMSQFTQVASGNLALPAGRGSTGTNALNNINSQTITFTNTSSFKEYLIIFPTVKDATTANSMQIGDVQLFGVAAYNNITWTGSNGAIWNINGTPNWLASGAPVPYGEGNGVFFDDNASASSTNISIQSGGTGVHPAIAVFQNNVLNYTIGGDSISSAGTLTLNGTGSVTLNNTNNYAAGVLVNAGTLTIGAAGSIGSGPLTVNNGNTAAGSAVAVTFNSPQSIGTLSGSIGAPASGTNTVTITLSGGITINQSADAAFAGIMVGSGGLTKNGNGMLVLTGVNTYTGPTTVNAGALQSAAPGDNPQGALPAGQQVTVNSGAVLLFGADDGVGYYEGSASGVTVNGGTVITAANTHSTLPAVTLNGGTITSADQGNFSGSGIVSYILDGDVTTVPASTPSTISAATIRLRKDPLNTGTSSALTFNVPRGTAPVDLSISSIITDGGAGLIKSGNGILSLSNANTYLGPTIINAGTILVRNNSALGLGNVTINSSGVLSFGAATTFNGFVGFALNGGAFADFTYSTATLTDNGTNQARSVFSMTQVPINQGFTASFVYAAGGNRTADGLTFTIQNNSPFVVGTAGGGLGYGGLANSAALEFNLYTGANPAQPVGTNFATGGTTGTYLASNPVNLSSGRPILVKVVYDPAALTLTETLLDQITQATYTHVFTGVNIPGAIGGSSGYVGFTGGTGGSVATQTIGNFTFDNFTQGVTLTNPIAIAAGATAGFKVLPLSASGMGTATLQGTLTLNADVTLNVTGGASPTNTPYALTVTGATTIAGNATFDVANSGTGVGSLILDAVGQQTAGTTLTKRGAGTLTLGGVATYSGVTTVNNGTLIVNGAVTGALTTVNSGATLAGTGTLNAVTIASGGTLAPGIGTDVGTLITGPLSLQGGSTFKLEISLAASDQVKVTGAATLDGTIALSIALNVDPADNTTFTILDGTAPLVGYSAGARFSYAGTPLGQGAQFTVNSGSFTQAFSIDYTADSGCDVVLIAIPEPTGLATLLPGLAALLALRRRRRS